MSAGAGDMKLRPLGMDAGGCTESCSEGHTYSWPCEQSMMPVDLRWRDVARMVWCGKVRPILGRPAVTFFLGTYVGIVLSWAVGG